ncbi:hypothetical protein ABPG75_003133 [Micractinium tetrahymenae]
MPPPCSLHRPGGAPASSTQRCPHREINGEGALAQPRLEGIAQYGRQSFRGGQLGKEARLEVRTLCCSNAGQQGIAGGCCALAAAAPQHLALAWLQTGGARNRGVARA